MGRTILVASLIVSALISRVSLAADITDDPERYESQSSGCVYFLRPGWEYTDWASPNEQHAVYPLVPMGYKKAASPAECAELCIANYIGNGGCEYFNFWPGESA